MALGLMDMDIPLWRVVVEKKIHLVVENFHTSEVVYIGLVVLESNCVGIGAVLCMVHMVHKVVGMVDKG